MIDQKSKIKIILKSIIYVLLGANGILFWMYLFENNWNFVESFQKLYSSPHIIYIQIISIIAGAIFGWYDLRKKEKKIVQNNS